MDPLPHNFYYDPVRQGVGKSVWNWYSATPYQNGGYLVLLDGAGVMYYDLGKGCVSFVLNVPHNPTDFSTRQWGLKAGDDYVLFDVSGGTFQAKAASTIGSVTASKVIAWDNTNWTGADVTFMIRWEAGMATFYINGVVYAVLSDVSLTTGPILPSPIPCGPLSPFINNTGGDLFMIESVVGQGLQTLILNPAEVAGDNPGPGPISYMRDKLTASEVVTITNSSLGTNTVSDSVSTAGDADVVTESLDVASGVSDSMTVGEAKTVVVQMTFTRSVSDGITATDVVSNSHTA